MESTVSSTKDRLLISNLMTLSRASKIIVQSDEQKHELRSQLSYFLLLSILSKQLIIRTDEIRLNYLA